MQWSGMVHVTVATSLCVYGSRALARSSQTSVTAFESMLMRHENMSFFVSFRRKQW